MEQQRSSSFLVLFLAPVKAYLEDDDVSEILTIADYAYILAGTKVVAGGTPEELKKSEDPRVRQFIKGEYDGPVPFNYPTEVSYLKDL